MTAGRFLPGGLEMLVRRCSAVRRAFVLAVAAVGVLSCAGSATAATPLDSGYGTGGLTAQVWKTLSLPAVEQMLVLPDGKLLVAGSAIPDPFVNHSYGDLIVGRLLANGTPDPGFGTNGRTVVQLLPNCSSCYTQHLAGMALQSTGKIVLAAARENNNGQAQPALARLTKDGAIDATFGNGGAVDTAFGAGTQTIPNGVAVDTGYAQDIFTGGAGVAVSDNAIVWVGNGFGSHLVEKFSPEGVLDTTYATGGRLAATLPGMISAVPTAAAAVGDGSVLTGGSSSAVWHTNGCTCGDGSKLSFAHITSAGAFDGGPGTANFHIKVYPDDTNVPPVPMTTPTYHEVYGVPSLAARPGGSSWFAAFDSHWYKGGLIPTHPGSGIGVATVGPTGATTVVGVRERDLVQSLLDAKTDPSGRLYVLTKETSFPGTPAVPAKYTLLRFTAAGAADPTLAGGAGEVSLDVPKAPTRIAVEADGSVLVGGTRATAPSDAQVARIPAAALGDNPPAPGGGGGGGSTPVTPSGSGTPGTPTTPIAAVAVARGLGATLKLKALSTLKVKVNCTAACTVKLAARIQLGGTKPKAAKAVSLKLAGGTATLTAAGTKSVAVKLSSKNLTKLRAALKARKKAWLVLTFTGTGLSKPVVRVVQLKA